MSAARADADMLIDDDLKYIVLFLSSTEKLGYILRLPYKVLSIQQPPSIHSDVIHEELQQPLSGLKAIYQRNRERSSYNPLRYTVQCGRDGGTRS